MNNDRQWLIRTTTNQIIGPVPNEKIIELIQKGAISKDDEICSGNGYWFWIREKDLLDKYVYGDLPQSFNPISEAPSVLSSAKEQDQTSSINNLKKGPSISKTEVGVLVPAQDDLEFPDVNQVFKSLEQEMVLPQNDDLEFPDLESDITLVVNPDQLKNQAQQVSLGHEQTSTEIRNERRKAKAKVETETNPNIRLDEWKWPNADDLAFPDEMKSSSGKEETSEASEKKVMGNEPPAIPSTGKNSKPAEKKPILHERKVKTLDKKNAPAPKPERVIEQKFEKRNDSYLIFIFIILLIIIAGIFFYYKEILNRPIQI